MDCRTHVSGLEVHELASAIMNVNDHATNSFIQQIRRITTSVFHLEEEIIRKTPAQRIGLTNKVFDIKDIIYMK